MDKENFCDDGKCITNLNFLDDKKLLIDQKNRIYIIQQLYRDNKTHTLKLIEINKDFTLWMVTLPTACDEQYWFISDNDDSYDFQFKQLDINKENLSSDMIKMINN